MRCGDGMGSVEGVADAFMLYIVEDVLWTRPNAGDLA